MADKKLQKGQVSACRRSPIHEGPRCSARHAVCKAPCRACQGRGSRGSQQRAYCGRSRIRTLIPEAQQPHKPSGTGRGSKKRIAHVLCYNPPHEWTCRPATASQQEIGQCRELASPRLPGSIERAVNSELRDIDSMIKQYEKYPTLEDTASNRVYHEPASGLISGESDRRHLLDAPSDEDISAILAM